ncbi:angiopoietin-2-like [Saccostrea echinata]|uniref:angiopoietin-2-like n=1 Tax=Saccostrea echinata TaxID=191078 RepID=UPI002A8342C5|nr:angiopoietin-2-like [Saccostrea echinata]
MVQRIQRLVMDAIDNKNNGQIIKTKLRDVIKELQDLETKDQRIEAENSKLKQEMKALNVTLNNTKYLTMEEFRNLNETGIWNLRTHLIDKLQAIEKKEQRIMEQFKSLNESGINNLNGQALTLQKENQKLTVESSKTKTLLSVIERKIDILNSSYSSSKNEIQKLTLQNDKLLRGDIRKLNETLLQNFYEHIKKIEGMFTLFSLSVNETLDAVSGEQNKQNVQWIQISPYIYSLTDLTENFINCLDILRKYSSQQGRDGVYKLTIASKTKFVYCDMTTQGGGWTAIQRRQDGFTNFYRTWSEYKRGFGDPSKNYWIGNDAIYELTKNKDQELRVELQSFDGAEAYAHYSTFYVGDEYSKYRLTLSGYSGTAGDSLKNHNGSHFSTKDQDNERSSRNCATQYHGAWWYWDCLNSNLNGVYAQSPVSNWNHPVWQHWRSNTALQKTMMMIRHTKLYQHLKSSRWFWKPTRSHVKTVHSVSFKVDVVSTYNVTKISKDAFIKVKKYKDCATILKKNPGRKRKDGVYTIYPDGKQKKKVYCDMTTKGGGWTAIQRRQDGSTDFYRAWSEYKQGFGNPSKNYWIGNDAIYELTKNKDQELRVSLQRFNGDEAYAQYSTFYVGDENKKYKLTVSGYSGTAGDSLTSPHSGSKFSTKDQDNDRISGHCATRYRGAWWYGSGCYNSNLNGEYAKSAVSGNRYPIWHSWKGWEALKQTMMMIRYKH